MKLVLQARFYLVSPEGKLDLFVENWRMRKFIKIVVQARFYLLSPSRKQWAGTCLIDNFASQPLAFSFYLISFYICSGIEYCSSLAKISKKYICAVFPFCILYFCGVGLVIAMIKWGCLTLFPMNSKGRKINNNEKLWNIWPAHIGNSVDIKSRNKYTNFVSKYLGLDITHCKKYHLRWM